MSDNPNEVTHKVMTSGSRVVDTDDLAELAKGQGAKVPDSAAQAVAATGAVSMDAPSPAPKPSPKTEEPAEEQVASEDPAGPEGEDEEGPEEEAPAELTEERLAELDAEYRPEGRLDLAAVSKSWWDSARGPDGEIDFDKGRLAPEVYSYLGTQFGLDKAEVDEVMAGQVARLRYDQAESAKARALADGAIISAIGGEDVYFKALAWGRENYSEADREAFNKITNDYSLSPSVRQMAMESLVARYQAAQGPKPAAKAKVPSRDATKGLAGSSPSVRPFADSDEWAKARREAGSDPTQQLLVAQRLKASKWAGGK